MSEVVFDTKGNVDLRETLRAFAKKAPNVKRARAQVRARWQNLQAAPTGLKGKSLSSWKANRGYELERLLLVLAGIDGLEPQPPLRPKGEQIDGMFILPSHHILVEAKWQGTKTTAADVFAFQGKLRGKLIGTLGLFVSVGGFSDDAPAAVAYGKEVNVILADAPDVELAIEHGLARMVLVKLREAARTGAVYYPFQQWLDAQKAP